MIHQQRILGTKRARCKPLNPLNSSSSFGWCLLIQFQCSHSRQWWSCLHCSGPWHHRLGCWHHWQPSCCLAWPQGRLRQSKWGRELPGGGTLSPCSWSPRLIQSHQRGLHSGRCWMLRSVKLTMRGIERGKGEGKGRGMLKWEKREAIYLKLDTVFRPLLVSRNEGDVILDKSNPNISCFLREGLFSRGEGSLDCDMIS